VVRSKKDGRVIVARNGKPAVEAARATATNARQWLTREQERAFEAFMDAALNRPGNSKGERRWSREELHER
jgi:hypothetical protein